MQVTGCAGHRQSHQDNLRNVVTCECPASRSFLGLACSGPLRPTSLPEESPVQDRAFNHVGDHLQGLDGDDQDNDQGLMMAVLVSMAIPTSVGSEITVIWGLGEGASDMAEPDLALIRG